MRIISGLYKGRLIEGYNIDGTRPTMDRVRESLFAIIQDYIKDSTVLDLFAGSGALGLEALSNHAKFCYLNDTNKMCLKTITNTINNLKANDKAKVLNLDYKDALKYFHNNTKFDIIFLDPPYKDKNINTIIELIDKYDLLNPKGIIVCETDTNYIDITTYEEIKNKKYGDKFIIIYRK